MGIFIDKDAVRRLLSWSDSIGYLEEMLHHEAEGRTFVSPKFNSDIETGSMRILFAADYITGFGATKAYHTIEGVGSRYLVSLIDISTGEQLAIVDGRRITDLRTGAASGVVGRKVPIDGEVKVGIVGSGHQARAQLYALAAAYDITSAEVYSPTPANRESFSRELGDDLSISVTPVETPEQACRGKSVVAAATMSRQEKPVVLGAWLEDCRLLLAVGNTRPQYREIDQRCFEMAEKVVIDSVHALTEAGELAEAVESGRLGAEKQVLLARLVADGEPLRSHQLVIFKSVGTALQDLALAGKCYEQLREKADADHFPDLECS